MVDKFEVGQEYIANNDRGSKIKILAEHGEYVWMYSYTSKWYVSALASCCTAYDPVPQKVVVYGLITYSPIHRTPVVSCFKTLLRRSEHANYAASNGHKILKSFEVEYEIPGE